MKPRIEAFNQVLEVDAGDGIKVSIRSSSDGVRHVFVPIVYRNLPVYTDKWHMNRWKENGVEYAVVIGNYHILDYVEYLDRALSGNWSVELKPIGGRVYEFTLLVERSPVDPRWRFTQYRGKSSGYDESDYYQIRDYVGSRLRAAERDMQVRAAKYFNRKK